MDFEIRAIDAHPTFESRILPVVGEPAVEVDEGRHDRFRGVDEEPNPFAIRLLIPDAYKLAMDGLGSIYFEENAHPQQVLRPPFRR